MQVAIQATIRVSIRLTASVTTRVIIGVSDDLGFWG